MAQNGIHVLQQVSGLSQLNTLEPQIRAALRRPGVTSLCVRIPWRASDRYAVYDRALAIARSEGKAFYPRWMAGRHTPSTVIQAGPHYTWQGTDAFGRPQGPYEIPLPCNPDGSPNLQFEAAFRAECEQLAAWAVANQVTMIHYPWYGRLWAELDVGIDVTTKPGNTMANVITAHKRLYDIAWASFGGEIEFPFSGHGPATQFINAFVAYFKPRTIFQMNGTQESGVMWTPNTSAEVIDPPPSWTSQEVGRGFQMVGTSNTYNWDLNAGPDDPGVLARVRESAVNADDDALAAATYLEIYLESFSGGTSAQLFVEAAEFKAWQDDLVVVEPDPLAEALARIVELEAEVAQLQSGLAAAELEIGIVTAELGVAQDKLQQIHTIAGS